MRHPAQSRFHRVPGHVPPGGRSERGLKASETRAPSRWTLIPIPLPSPFHGIFTTRSEGAWAKTRRRVP